LMDFETGFISKSSTKTNGKYGPGDNSTP